MEDVIQTSELPLKCISDTNSPLNEGSDTITNGNLLEVIDDTLFFKENIQKLKTLYPLLEWGNTPVKVLQLKVKRLQTKVAELKKNKNLSGLETLFSKTFELPSKNVPINDRDDKKIVKRQLVQEQSFNAKLNHEIQKCQTKSDLLLNLLESTNEKHSKCIEQNHELCKLRHESNLWQKKYSQLASKLDGTLEELESKKQQLHTLNAKNFNKKIKRRDEKILRQGNLLKEKNGQILEIESESESKSQQIDSLKAEKRNLFVKICRLKKRTTDDSTFEHIDSEIQVLKEEISRKNERILELEGLYEVINSEHIESFYNGKFSNEIRQTIMTLCTKCGVSQKKVNEVISTVVQNLTGKTLSRLPSAGVRSRLLIEAKRVAQLQIVDVMLRENNELLTGNCLHQDGTSKFHRHFQSFQVTTKDKETYSLGLTEIGSADAATLVETFKAQISDLAKCLKNDDKTFAKLISSIVATMSDQGSVNPVFNRQLEDFRQSLLPDVIENWEHMSVDKRAGIGKIASFFCKMHIFVNMASEVDKCLSVFEQSVCNGSNPFALNDRECGATRLTRTASKAFTEHGCEKSGVASHFLTYLKEKGVSSKMITFRGHRFNHLFFAAGATYHHLNDITEFLDSWSDPNDLLKCISFDVREKVFISGVRALGIIDKLITGPFWRIIESSDNILSLTSVLKHLQAKLTEISTDGSCLLNGEAVFPDVNINKDEIYNSIFTISDDPVLETYTQMAVELCTGGMLLILERQAKDHLVGGVFSSPSEEDKLRGAAVPTTNTCSERDFAQLDILMRLKPSATTTSLESIIMWSNNKTSAWLSNLSPSAKAEVLQNARESAPEMLNAFKDKKQDLFKKKLEVLKRKRERKAAMEEKNYQNKVRLTSKLQAVGGLWRSAEDLQQNKLILDNFKDALVTQLLFRKHVLGSRGPKEYFQQSAQGKPFSIIELEKNLLQVIIINEENHESDEEGNSNRLRYVPLDAATQNITTAKSTYALKLKENRMKNVVQQQARFLPQFIEDPSLLLGKNILHKFKESGSNEITWYPGKVLSFKQSNGRLTKFEVLYSGEDEECTFPLLIDMERGDLQLVL